MMNVEECVIDSVMEREKIDLSKCKDDRNNVKVGDKVAMLFFNNADWDIGRLENIGGKLGIPIGKGSVGFVEDAYNVVKLDK